MTKKQEPEDNLPAERVQVLGGNTPIHVKFIGWLVITCAAGFGGSIWWAATMSAKMDQILENQAKELTASKIISDDVTRLKEWRVQIDTVGSPTMVKRMEKTDEELRALREKFELHVATTIQNKDIK